MLNCPRGSSVVGGLVVGLTLTVGIGCTEDVKTEPLAAPKVAGKDVPPASGILSGAASSQPAGGAPDAITNPKPVGKRAAISKYRKGDKVIYNYSGSYSAVPVTLTEEVLSVTAGNVLEIKVTAQRGKAKRVWVQVVTDTPENQRSNLVDALFELDQHGQRKKLDNIRANLFRLYEWTLPTAMDKPPEATKPSKEAVDILGTEYMCDVERGTNAVGGKNVSFAFRQCPGFLWTKGPSELVTTDGGVIWKVTVLSSTRAK